MAYCLLIVIYKYLDVTALLVQFINRTDISSINHIFLGLFSYELVLDIEL